MNKKVYTSLSTRPAFNSVLRHLVSVSSIIDDVEKGENLADILNSMLDADRVQKDQIGSILNVILNSRLNLPHKSHNLDETVSSFLPFVTSFSRWTGVNLVVSYYHPTLGLLIVNPANEDHWSSIHELKKDELIVVYAQSKDGKRETANKAIDAFFEILAGKIPNEDEAFIDRTPKKPEPAPAPAQPAAQVQQQAAPAPAQQQAAPAPRKAAPKAGKSRLTPKYSVQVSNELFHNGNVEAWKNIIESYEAKYQGLQVIVYHEGELIQDLNALFKWGKVKHGGLIMFQVAGENIKGVSRLQKYLYEGASPRFEAFMKHDINKALNLF